MPNRYAWAEDDEAKVEMTPMIDVTFLLLVFFLCTLRFKSLEGNLEAYLPKGAGASEIDSDPKEKVEVVLVVRTRGTRVLAADPQEAWRPTDDERRFEWVGRQVAYRVGSRATLDPAELEVWLRELRARDAEVPATVDARDGATYGDVVVVLDALAAAGFDSVSFVGVR